jgi:hypothetical protein
VSALGESVGQYAASRTCSDDEIVALLHLFTIRLVMLRPKATNDLASSPVGIAAINLDGSWPPAFLPLFPGCEPTHPLNRSGGQGDRRLLEMRAASGASQPLLDDGRPTASDFLPNENSKRVLRFPTDCVRSHVRSRANVSTT